MEEAKDILRKLVSINTIKDKENRTIINYLEELLTKYGFVVESKDKNLVMKNKTVQGLGFVGHTDTVEYIDGWKYPKFDITTKNGKIYGLGVCDMKGSIAAIISAISLPSINIPEKCENVNSSSVSLLKINCAFTLEPFVQV